VAARQGARPAAPLQVSGDKGRRLWDAGVPMAVQLPGVVAGTTIAHALKQQPVSGPHGLADLI
jgi:hypothetical protein